MSGDTLSSLPQASFNYINSIVGSGVIGIPYALHRAGFGLGLALLILVAYITDYSLILMVSGCACGQACKCVCVCVCLPVKAGEKLKMFCRRKRKLNVCVSDALKCYLARREEDAMKCISAQLRH